jgi:hypothetical protein
MLFNIDHRKLKTLAFIGILKAGQFFQKLKFGAQKTRVPQKFASVEICVHLFVARRKLVCYRRFETASYWFLRSRVRMSQKSDDFKYIAAKV